MKPSFLLARLIPLALVLSAATSLRAAPSFLWALEASDVIAATPEDTLYASGMKALNENRWADAAGTFRNLAARNLNHAPAALYWEAYAESKLGHNDKALGDCKKLRKTYAKSRWVDECGALEIELSGQNGQPVKPGAEHDDDLKLLALSTELAQNDPAALAQIDKILTSDAPEHIKERALFVLAQSRSTEAHGMLTRISATPSNPGLQARASQLLAAQAGSSGAPRRITIDAVVADKLGHPVQGLQAQDFGLFDNNQAQKITSFRAVDGNATRSDPVQVIIVVDMVNVEAQVVAREREELGEFLNQDGGRLSHPTTIAVMTDTGIKVKQTPSLDGHALLVDFKKVHSDVRVIGAAAGFYGAVERLGFSLSELSQLANFELTRPGRKLVLVISPGWPMLVEASAESTRKQQAWIYNSVIDLTNRLRESRISLYGVDPFGLGRTNPFFYQSYLKPVRDVGHADYADLSLQVLSVHSGGSVLISGRDVLGELNTAVHDAGSYYELSFDAPPAERANEYHSIQVHVDKPDVVIRAADGYYANPQPLDAPAHPNPQPVH